MSSEGVLEATSVAFWRGRGWRLSGILRSSGRARAFGGGGGGEVRTTTRQTLMTWCMLVATRLREQRDLCQNAAFVLLSSVRGKHVCFRPIRSPFSFLFFFVLGAVREGGGSRERGGIRSILRFCGTQKGGFLPSTIKRSVLLYTGGEERSEMESSTPSSPDLIVLTLGRQRATEFFSLGLGFFLFLLSSPPPEDSSSTLGGGGGGGMRPARGKNRRRNEEEEEERSYAHFGRAGDREARDLPKQT